MRMPPPRMRMEARGVAGTQRRTLSNGVASRPERQGSERGRHTRRTRPQTAPLAWSLTTPRAHSSSHALAPYAARAAPPHSAPQT